MAHFAKLDANKIVQEVIVLNNSVVGEPEKTFPETEPIGQDFINNVLKLDGQWKQTSYNGSFRGTYAGIGFVYDEIQDKFIQPQQ